MPFKLLSVSSSSLLLPRSRGFQSRCRSRYCWAVNWWRKRRGSIGLLVMNKLVSCLSPCPDYFIMTIIWRYCTRIMNPAQGYRRPWSLQIYVLIIIYHSIRSYKLLSINIVRDCYVTVDPTEICSRVSTLSSYKMYIDIWGICDDLRVAWHRT